MSWSFKIFRIKGIDSKVHATLVLVNEVFHPLAFTGSLSSTGGK